MKKIMVSILLLKVQILEDYFDYERNIELDLTAFISFEKVSEIYLDIRVCEVS